MSVHEECGVFGVIAEKPSDVADMAYYGLFALQHRGQESCGIVVNDDGVFVSHKDLGLVNDVFTKKELQSLPKGTMAVAHTRYATTGSSRRSNCQPIEVNHQKGKMALAHNGNISNAAKLRNDLELSGAIFHTSSDTEIIAYLVTKERLKTSSIEDAVCKAVKLLEGAYSLILMSAQKLIAVRDPHGFRPLCYGRRPDGTYVVASESCALNAVGAEFIRDIYPGEVLIFSRSGICSRTAACGTENVRHCIFEYIYFSRPDSVIDGVSVQSARVKAGEILAREHYVPADLVIGVPDSGLDAALGYSRSSGIPYGIGLIKNKYIGRTFISPKNRSEMVRMKLAAVESAVKDKRIILVDDSIVRGTTSSQIVGLLRSAGAKEVHMRVSAPPFKFPCYYGTDIDSTDNLIACHHTSDEIAKMIGADTLGFLPVNTLHELIGGYGCCSACFDGDYPTKIPSDTRKDRFEQKLSAVES